MEQHIKTPRNKRPKIIEYKRLLAVGLAGIEIVLLSRYVSAGDSTHFFLHLLVGVNVALLLFMAAHLFKRRLRHFILWAFGLHQYAMLPDYLYQAGYRHETWMNLFLGHVALDDLPYKIWVMLGFLVILAVMNMKNWLDSTPRGY